MSIILFLFILLLVAPFDMIICSQLLNNTNCSGFKYSNGSVRQSNLAKILADLPSDASQTGFVNTSIGDGQDRIFGLAICLAGFPLSSCQNCLELAVKNLTTTPKCQNSTSGVSWYDHCMVHYTRQLFFDIPQINYSIHAFWGNSEPNGGRLETTVYNLINNLSDSAANNSTRFALGQDSYLENSSNITIYALAQCTTDLSADNCSRCLDNYTATLKNETAGSTHRGGSIVGESCFILYDDKPLSDTSGNPHGGGGEKRSSKTIIIVMAVSVVAGLLVIVIYFIWLRKRTTKTHSIRRATEYRKLKPDIRIYSIYELKAATQNFSLSKRLGQGGYGEVYQAVMHGKSVAVKKLLKATKENEQELEKELSLVSNIEHPNILKLVGYCFEENQYFFVYEHMPNGSLDRHLKDPAGRQKLMWGTRFKIIKDIAQGLSYFHYGLDKRITHVDLKLANILLSEEMTAKIADFDMLRTFETNETHQSTEKGYGTRGYMAPEVNVLAIRKNYSLKSDVYSFGIMVLEIVTGKGIHTFRKSESHGNLSESDESLTSFVWNRWNRKKFQEVLDPYLDLQILHDNEQMVRCIHIGLLCIQHDAAKRPDMLDVQKMLNTKVHLSPPSVPGFIMY